MTDLMTEISKSEEIILVPDGIAVIDRQFKIIAFNESAQRITGFSEGQIISKDINFLFSLSEENNNYILDALNNGKSYSNLSMEIAHSENSFLNVMVSINPIEQPSHGIIGVIIVFRDIQEMISIFNELQLKNKELLNEKNKMEAIFNSRMEGTFTIDLNWNITSFNRAAEKITGFSSEEALGKKCREIFRSSKCANGCHMQLTMKEKQPTTSNELMIINKNNQKIPVRVNSAPLYDGSGNQIGAVETFQDISEIKNLTSQLEERFHFQNIIGRSKPMQQIYELMGNVIQSDSNILITGESGTGKEIVARAIHINSERKLAPFMAINCSAFAETLLESELFGHEKGAFTGAIRTKQGRFELAGEGTLFLDEIGDLTLPTQVKLLRVLETRQFERVGGTQTIKLKARLITATNKDLEKEIKSGRFREDLFYRINVINIKLPPLRERIDDLLPLISYFMEKFNKKFNKNITSISPSASRILKNYKWPGNIRELENVLEHAFVVCRGDAIDTEHLPERLWSVLDDFPDSDSNIASKKKLKTAEKSFILDTLRRHKGNRKKTAEALGIDRTTLWRKMKKLGLFR